MRGSLIRDRNAFPRSWTVEGKRCAGALLPALSRNPSGSGRLLEVRTGLEAHGLAGLDLNRLAGAVVLLEAEGF